MIRQLTGTITTKTDQTVVLDVHGVGYLITVPETTSFNLNAEASLHTYLAVRETALDLYGFLLADELELFEQLLTLPKIGPKSAMQILSQASLELIKTAIANNDPAHLSKMSGMGKKTAEKVVAGLSELYEKHGLELTIAPEAGASGLDQRSDTVDALIALGYPEQAARKAAQQVLDEKPELTETNQILKEALRLLS